MVKVVNGEKEKARVEKAKVIMEAKVTNSESQLEHLAALIANLKKNLGAAKAERDAIETALNRERKDAAQTIERLHEEMQITLQNAQHNAGRDFAVLSDHQKKVEGAFSDLSNAYNMLSDSERRGSSRLALIEQYRENMGNFDTLNSELEIANSKAVAKIATLEKRILDLEATLEAANQHIQNTITSTSLQQN